MSDPRMNNMVSVIIPCKGRLHHLKKTLPALRKQKCTFEYEIIIVDYGCPDDTFDWCKSQNVSAIKVLDNTEYFNPSRARNCGATIARGTVFAFLDADMRPKPDWLSQTTSQIILGQAGLSHIGCGTCAVSAVIFYQVLGYDESIEAYGFEDEDFFRRCVPLTPEVSFDALLLDPIKHTDDERVKFFRIKDMHAHRDARFKFFQEKDIRDNVQCNKNRNGINPGGYGQGRFEVYRVN